ncbi:hypothetical protein KP509_18G045600 [Ceratopteris richardii]|uniref:Kinesin-like protein n=1 Tax=Ceratopteris richardii TaxID=49495 RepID=A0A8T2SRE4_CERRI|nr:hypothetical protein KP509_18G045600 [Ceratopteris richardii]
MNMSSYANCISGTIPSSSEVQAEKGISLNTQTCPTRIRPKTMSSAASIVRRTINHRPKDNGGSVKVALRLRPRNSEELENDADLTDYVELLPEMKLLRLRKNNWDYEEFEFDEVLDETVSQKEVYDVVMKPVVKAVLEGYNGAVIAYGSAGTGKTFTLANLGKENYADRGVMVRSIEDILDDFSFGQDSVSVSYLQLYLEAVKDLLAPEKGNLAITEDPETGDISLPGATSVELKDRTSFLDLLTAGDANRNLPDSKMNIESTRSHTLLLVEVRKTVKGKQGKYLTASYDGGVSLQTSISNDALTIKKSKLWIVDLAGSEIRENKSGNEGLSFDEAKFVNLSLTALGRSFHAFAEGASRTSLIITIGPSLRHKVDTRNSILFGQRAMKAENMRRVKDDFDYETLCRDLQAKVDQLTAENERQSNLVFDAEKRLKRITEEVELTIQKSERQAKALLEESHAKILLIQKENMESIKKLKQECHQLEKDLNENTRKFCTQNECVALEKTQIEDEISRKQQEMEECLQEYHRELSDIIARIDKECIQRQSVERRLKELEDQMKARKRNLNVPK